MKWSYEIQKMGKLVILQTGTLYTLSFHDPSGNKTLMHRGPGLANVMAYLQEPRSIQTSRGDFILDPVEQEVPLDLDQWSAEH